MAIKTFYSLTTIPGTNEQTGVGQTTQTTSGLSREYGFIAAESKGLFLLDVSAASGATPSLTVTIEGLHPGSAKWETIVTFPAQTAVTNATVPLASIAVSPLYHQIIRTRWVISGSFTFSVGVITLSDEPIF